MKGKGFSVKKYVEASHINALLELISQPESCSICPYLLQNKFPSADDCATCLSFVNAIDWCPCNYFGPHEALKRTYLKLEEIGVI